MSSLNKKTKVLIATFSPWINGKRLSINGNLEPMLDFFLPKVRKTILIDQVYPGSDFVMPRIEIHESGRKTKVTSSSWWLYFLLPFLKLTNYGGTHIPFKLRDFFSVIDCGFRYDKTYDYIIGFEAINALAGIILRKLGKAKIVIYYVSDYSPNRYKRKWFNSFYLWLDRYCVTHSDYIWDVSTAIQPARVKAGFNFNPGKKILHVPNALYPAQIRIAQLKDIIPYSLVFMGTLGVENGSDLAIESLPYILKKFPKTVLNIVGGGDFDLERLEKIIYSLKLEEKVIFHGFISDRKEVSKTIRKFMVALAPYTYIPGSARLYGDATKIRAYLGAGLPVITTSVPPLGKEVEEKGAALIVKDSKEALGEAVINIFSNKVLYLKLKKNAIKFAKENTWENEYKKAFMQMI